jgi:catechol 2,3-dioxygenase-like lactoylglutathione lyase family enzyme
MSSHDIPRFGRLHVCLNVADIAASHAFYATLGFSREEGDLAEKWLVMEREGIRIGLFQGHWDDPFSLNFRGGDVPAIARALESAGLTMERVAATSDAGCGSATIRDPDGHLIFFDTAPNELLDDPA